MTTGDRSVAIGPYALDACTTGQYNVGIGNAALGSLTTADDNVAIGNSAGAAATTGTLNTGYYAGMLLLIGSNHCRWLFMH